MLHDIIKKGSTDRSVRVRIIDSTDGTPETGVVFNTSGIDLWYRRAGATKTSITEATLSALNDAHSDGGFLHIGDGYYRLDLPDAAFATGANYVEFGGTVTGMVVIGGVVKLVDYDPEDATAYGLSRLDAAITTRSSHSAADVWAAATRTLTAFDNSFKTGYALSAAGVQAIWDALTAALTTANSIGKLLVDNINATISSRASQTSVDTIDDFVDDIEATLADATFGLSAIETLVDELESRLTSTVATVLQAHAPAVLRVAVGTGSTTTEVVFDTINGGAPSATDDFYNGQILKFTSGSLAGQLCEVTDYTGATTTATVSALTGAPANGVTAVMV